MIQKLYSTQEAADYLGISLSTFKYHIHIAKNIKPQKVGRSLVFTQDQLDDFSINRRPQGRPKKGYDNE